MAASVTADPPVEQRTVRALATLLAKRTFDMFAQNHGQKPPLDEGSQRAKVACKIRDEYAATTEEFKPRALSSQNGFSAPGSAARVSAADAQPASDASQPKSVTAKLIESMPEPADRAKRQQTDQQKALVIHQGQKALLPTSDGGQKEYTPSASITKRLPSKWPRPAWHAPWRNYRVVSGHLGWVRSIAFEPGNEWFCTGSADRTIKIWDLATGQLKLTLTGHIEQVTGLAVSRDHPYMFSCGLDKMVKCWDMEYNKVIRQYHGHLSGVYCLKVHNDLSLLLTGGRDSVCRVWDMRTKVQVHCLSGHDETVADILANTTRPEVITGSHDKTIRMYDIRKPSTISTLTYHKKSVRGLASHPVEYAFTSASADNLKKFSLPNGEFLHNMLQQQRAIVNSIAVNEDDVVVSGADNGSLWFWDWKSGNNFQAANTIVQPGSLESEAGIFALGFDHTGTRMLTCEADKTIKFWREDESATPETHPINFRPPKDMRRF